MLDRNRLLDTAPGSGKKTDKASEPASMGNLRYVLLTTLVVFTVLNILSVNLFNASKYDAKIENAFIEAKELRSKGTSKDGQPLEEVKNRPIKDHNGNFMTKLKSKDIYSLSTTLDRLLYNFPYNNEEEVEQNIYQMWKTGGLDPEAEGSIPKECITLVQRWKDANPDHEHNLLSIVDAEDAVADLLRPTVPEVVDALRMLPHPRLKFEFLKYLLLYLHGGVYADIDTINVKPVKHWYKLSMLSTKVWLGIDSDMNDPTWAEHYVRRLSFNNNIMRSKAHHPLFARLIARITFIIFTQKSLIESIDWIAEYNNVDASGAPLVQFTGTSILTDTAFEYMNNVENYAFFTNLKNKNYGKENAVLTKQTFGPEVDESQRFSYKKFTLLSSPVQVCDIGILPKISFTGHDSAEVDYFDDENEKRGYEKFYYGRSKDLTEWSPRKLRLDSN